MQTVNNLNQIRDLNKGSKLFKSKITGYKGILQNQEKIINSLSYQNKFSFTKPFDIKTEHHFNFPSLFGKI